MCPQAVTGTAVTSTPLGTFVAADTAAIILVFVATECAVATRVGHDNLISKAAGASFVVGTVLEDSTADCVARNSLIFLELISKCTRSLSDGK